MLRSGVVVTAAEGDAAVAPAKGWGVSRWPLFVLALVALIDAIDTSILRGVLPFIKEDFRLSDAEAGALGFAFVFVNSLAAIPAGWVADRFSRKRIIGWTLLSWSALSALSAGAFSFASLFVARASLGAGQAIDDPSSTSLLTDYYKPALRGRVFSWQQVSLFLGGGLGISLGGFVGDRLGWRWAFLIVGMPGSLIAFLVFRLREPRRGEADLHEIDVADLTVRPQDMPWSVYAKEAWRSLIAEMRMIFGIRTMRYILVGVGVLLFTVSGVGYWLAIYHQRYSGMTVTQSTAVTAAVLGVSGIIGTFGGGSVADRLHANGPQGRVILVSNAILACAVLFLISLMVPWVGLRLVLQFLGVLAIASAFPALRASMMDVVPTESRGVSASAFALASTVFGTALAPPLVGLLSDVLDSLVGAFYIVTPPIIVGALILRQAKRTIVEDAAAIFTAMVDRQQAVPHPPAV